VTLVPGQEKILDHVVLEFSKVCVVSFMKIYKFNICFNLKDNEIVRVKRYHFVSKICFFVSIYFNFYSL